jgi:hypothetical protein
MHLSFHVPYVPHPSHSPQFDHPGTTSLSIYELHLLLGEVLRLINVSHRDVKLITWSLVPTLKMHGVTSPLPHTSTCTASRLVKYLEKIYPHATRRTKRPNFGTRENSVKNVRFVLEPSLIHRHVTSLR